MKPIRLLQIIFAVFTVFSFIFLIITVSGNGDKDTLIVATVYVGGGLLGSVICAVLKPVLLMKRIFVYTEEQEREINKKLGYTQKDYAKLADWKPQWMWTLGTPEIKEHTRRSKQKECPVCGAKLEWIRECTYVGFRLPLRATGGNYRKTYEVEIKRYCPDCKKILERDIVYGTTNLAAR